MATHDSAIAVLRSSEKALQERLNSLSKEIASYKAALDQSELIRDEVVREQRDVQSAIRKLERAR